MKISHIPPRLATGAFILNTGIGKLHPEEDAAKRVHEMAVRTYPFFAKADPQDFVKALGAGEIVVGSVLLAPVVPAWLAGAALTGFSSALLAMYFNTPDMTKDDGIRPTPKGVPIAKDVWMLGAGLGLFLSGLGDRRRRKQRRKARQRKARQRKVGLYT